MGTTAAHRRSHGEIPGSDSPRGNKGKRQRATGNAEASPTKPGIPSQESQASESKPPYTHTHTLPPATPKAAAPTSTPERPSTVARLLPNNQPIRPGFAAPRRCEWTGTPHRHPGAGLSWVDDINPGEVSVLGHGTYQTVLLLLSNLRALATQPQLVHVKLPWLVALQG